MSLINIEFPSFCHHKWSPLLQGNLNGSSGVKSRLAIATKGFPTKYGLNLFESRIESDRLDGTYYSFQLKDESLVLLGDPHITFYLSKERENWDRNYAQYPSMLAAYIEETGSVEGLTVFALTRNSGKIEIYMTETLWQQLPKVMLNGIIFMVLNRCKGSSLHLINQEDLSEFLSNDFKNLHQMAHQGFELVEGCRSEFEAMGYSELSPLWRAGSSGMGNDIIRLLKAKDAEGEKVVIKFHQYPSTLDEHFKPSSIKRHPHVTHIFGSGVLQDHREYEILSYAEGEPLEDVVDRREAFTAIQVVRIMLQLAQGIQYFHELQTPHGDIALNNIHIDKEKNVSLMDPIYGCPSDYDESDEDYTFEQSARFDLGELGSVVLSTIILHTTPFLFEDSVLLATPEGQIEIVQKLVRSSLDSNDEIRALPEECRGLLDKIVVGLMTNMLSAFYFSKWDTFLIACKETAYESVAEALVDIESLFKLLSEG